MGKFITSVQLYLGAKWHTVFVPQKEITNESLAVSAYHPAKGYQYTLVVERADGYLIGWISTTTLGYDNVRQWARAVGHPIYTLLEAT